MSDLTLKSDCVELGITPVGGHLENVRFQTADGVFTPMHTAPWTDEPHTSDVPPMLRILRGDFFCAPFGDSDVLADEQRPHGSSANDRWTLVSRTDTRIELELARPILGARLRKRVSVRPGHAVVYQEHEFSGGRGTIPIGHHAMLRAPEPLLLSFSPWVWGGTPPTPLEPDPQRGRSLLAYPQTFDGLDHVRLADGRTTDISRYPTLDEHEDLLMLIADAARPYAWSAAVAPEAGWVWFALKNPHELRNTVLWLSHGGRFYPPFSRRHTHVIGIEETTSFFHLGHRASIEENFLNKQGHATAVDLRPDAPLRIRYAFGLAAVPSGFGRVRAIDPADGGINLTGESSRRVFAAVRLSHVGAAAGSF